MAELPEYNTVFIERECKRCGWEGTPITNGHPNNVHGHRLVCPVCGLFLAWGGKSKALKNKDGERAISTQWTAKRLGIGHCQLCLAEKEMVEMCGYRLEAHHLIPVKNGGADEPYNIIIVCTNCHHQVHANQARNRHFFQAWGKMRERNYNDALNGVTHEY